MPSKSDSRARWREARDLVNRWDPIGLIADGSPEDEYECIVGPLLRMLEASQPPAAISAYLENELAEHFGVPGLAASGFAREATEWYLDRWRESGA